MHNKNHPTSLTPTPVSLVLPRVIQFRQFFCGADNFFVFPLFKFRSNALFVRGRVCIDKF